MMNEWVCMDVCVQVCAEQTSVLMLIYIDTVDVCVCALKSTSQVANDLNVFFVPVFLLITDF